MSLKDIQKDADEWTSQFTPQYWPALEMMARLSEETGEVARAMNHLHGTKKRKAEEANQELGQELSDVLFTISCIANSHNINLDEEWKKMIDSKLYKRDKDRFEKKA